MVRETDGLGLGHLRVEVFPIFSASIAMAAQTMTGSHQTTPSIAMMYFRFMAGRAWSCGSTQRRSCGRCRQGAKARVATPAATQTLMGTFLLRVVSRSMRKPLFR